MLRLALGALARHRRLAATLYLAELGAAMIVTIAVGWSLAEVFAERPILDRAVAGDLGALVLAFETRVDLLLALTAGALAVALAWAVLSWYLGAGLVGALAGRPFGETAGRRFWSFARLWVWTVVPWGIAGFAVLIGLDLLGDQAATRLSFTGFFAAAAGCLLPGVLLLSAVACVVDHARVLLVLDAHESASAGRALAGALRLVFRRPRPLAWFLLYLGFWLGVSLLYTLCTTGRAYAGIGGAVALFLVRQLTLASRFAARVTLTAAQVAYVTERARPGAS